LRTPELLSALDQAVTRSALAWLRNVYHLALAPVRVLCMIMGHVLLHARAIGWRKMRFAGTRYSMRSRSVWAIDPVI
jgi:hypothetical protein